jgi:hypothetical protein
METEPKSLRYLAEEAFRQVLSHLELSLGDQNVEVAKTLQCLARVLEEQGLHDEARAARHRAEKILCTH